MTAATAALDPEPIPGPGPGADADDTVTVSWADFRAWERQLTTCTHPIRLRGRIDAFAARPLDSVDSVGDTSGSGLATAPVDLNG